MGSHVHLYSHRASSARLGRAGGVPPARRRPRQAAAAVGDDPTTPQPPLPNIASTSDATAAVTALLTLIAGTDRGSAAPPSTAAAADDLIDALAAFGASQAPRPLDDENELLWGAFDVAYVGTRGTRQRGQPAGGQWRSGVGQALFATTFVGQGVYKQAAAGGPSRQPPPPPLATNLVAFRAFGGLLPGHIGLRGVVSVVADPALAARSAHPDSAGGDTVRVAFDPPELVLGAPAHPAAVALKIGPPSAVQLTTTYLDARVRLGRGSFGSRFVFTRIPGGDAAAGRLQAVGTHTTRPAGWAVCAGVLAACAAAVASLATRTPAWPLAARLVAGVLPALVGLCLGAAVVKDRLTAWRGPGRERGNEGSGRVTAGGAPVAASAAAAK